MAMNFLGQLLDLAGLKLPEAKDRYDPSVYIQEEIKPADKPSTAGTEPSRVNTTTKNRQEASELTGVAKYLAKKHEQEHPETAEATPLKADEPKNAQLSGVARYLAKLEREAQEKAKAEAAALANMSGVERYLARLEGKKLTSVQQPASASKTEEVQLTRVERYLSKQTEQAPEKTTAAPPKAPTKEEAPSTAPVETQAKQVVTVNKQAPANKTAEKQVSKPSTPIKKEPEAKTTPTDKVIDLTVNGEQCHATTSRGKRCRRSTGLKVMERTIDAKKYRLYACPQHNNKDFQASPDLLAN